MKAATNNTFKSDVLDSKKVILLDVWAPWCGPCRAMEPILESLEKDAEISKWADIVKVDASAEMDLVQSLGVSSLPTFMVYKDGQVVASSVGATSKEGLVDLLAQAQ